MASSSSSSSTKYDVFLSFRGEDTRCTFTSHLYYALGRKSIDVFIDDEEIERGDEIKPTLLTAIERSRISIVIFSKDYASSTWCLEELAKIIECKNQMQHIVLPVFYNIDPSDVRKQSGVYANAFVKHEKYNQDKVQKWRSALQEAANLAGWDSSNTRLESELIENIVKVVLLKLNSTASPQIPSRLVGVEKHIAHIESLLCNESADVHIVGIWGMGGVGKTTIAEVLFKKFSSQYEGHSFVENVREKCKQYGKHELRNNLWIEILGDQMHIENRLQRRKVLIVLDDVSDSQLMDYLIGEKSLYGPGSRIIVTTRNKDVIHNENIRLYEVMPLDHEEALQLFCLKAFQQYCPKDEFVHLSKMVVDYAGGNPLAISVLGSFLYSKNQEEWQGTLQKLKKVPNPKIHNVLRLSYEELDDQEKEIFLDIACCLKGEEKGKIIDLLDGCNFSISIGLRNLQDKSLITISEIEVVQMHDLIQEMGQHIVREESIKHPEKRSRLWDPEDIYHVLKCNMSNCHSIESSNCHSIESISLNLSQIKEVQISQDTFARMPNLRLLKFYMPEHHYKSNSPNYPCKCNVIIPKDLECLPNRLHYLCWDHFPMKALPSSICAEMLIEICLKYSPIKRLWDGGQDVANLKILRLKGCHELLELPCLKKAAKLKEIGLAFCRSLLHVPSYILSLDSLLKLDLRECTQLRRIQSDKPSKSLQVLDLYECSNLVEFSVASEKLKKLYLAGTAIKELSFSAGQLANLSHLSLNRCRRLKKLPHVPNSSRFIRSLHLFNCSNLSELPENLGHLSTLEQLCLPGSAIRTLPASIKLLRHLTILNVSDCKRLQSLPELPPFLRYLDAKGCIFLETVASIVPKALMNSYVGGQKMSLLPRQNQEPKTSIYPGFSLERFDFTNCTKLDENACKTILDEAAIRIKYAVYVSSMVEASINPYHQLYLCSEASDPELFDYTYRLFYFKYIADGYPDSTRIENEECDAFTANFNGISGGDLRRLILALELNKEENTNAHASMQRICMQQEFPIPTLRNVNKRWNMEVKVFLPGSRVPMWIRYRTKQTPFIITFQLPPSSHILDFAFCFVSKKSSHDTMERRIKCECEFYLEDGEGNQTSKSSDSSFYVTDFISDSDVFLYYPGRRFTKILEKLKEIRTIDHCSTTDSKLSFQFSFTPFSGKSIDGIKECGVWPIYASDLKSENPMESVELRVQPERNKLKKKSKRNLILWNCRWQALIMKMKMSKRNEINISSSSRIKGRMLKILNEQQQQLPLGEKSKRSQDIDELGGCNTNGTEKQDESQPLHLTKRLKKEKWDAEQ